MMTKTLKFALLITSLFLFNCSVDEDRQIIEETEKIETSTQFLLRVSANQISKNANNNTFNLEDYFVIDKLISRTTIEEVFLVTLKDDVIELPKLPLTIEVISNNKIEIETSARGASDSIGQTGDGIETNNTSDYNPDSDTGTTDSTDGDGGDEDAGGGNEPDTSSEGNVDNSGGGN